MSRQAPPDKDGPRVNRDIRARTIRLIDENGEMIGIVGVFEGLRLAEEAGLDLVEVSPNAEPPVCKILDAGKYKYELQKRANEAKKKQKIIEIKEVKLRPTIGSHDYEIKIRQVRDFIAEGDKVKFTLRFRGREMAHQDIGYQLLMRAQKDIEDIAKIEQIPRLEGKQMIMMAAPK
jgi:translation initiation factor IF-3